MRTLSGISTLPTTDLFHLFTMTDDDKSPHSDPQSISPQQRDAPAPPSVSTTPTPGAQPAEPTPAEDRSLLLSRARSFLQSPQIANQDAFSKRQFLLEKGLHESEINPLLRGAPSAPLIPPRTYPQPPPSNLPNLLLGLSRVFSWLTGGSAILMFIYYRFLLPRIAQSHMARHSLRTHHISLLRRLTVSLSSFKESQTEAWSILPKADTWREPLIYSKCSCIDDVLSSFGEKEVQYDSIPPVTLLRCGLADLAKGQDNEQNPTAEELCRYLEEKVPWLTSTDGLKYQQRLWEVFSSCPFFAANPPLTSPPTSQEIQAPSRWSYSPPLPPDPSPVVKSLSSLKLSLPKDQSSKSSGLQSTLQSLSDFVGYISTQVYMPYRPPTGGTSIGGAGTGSNLGPIEEQLRREIRALKGLVLNRRSFMPPMNRSGSLSASTP